MWIWARRNVLLSALSKVRCLHFTLTSATEFQQGKVFLDIREYFGPDNDEKPGKKGISLHLEQVCAIVCAIYTTANLTSKKWDTLKSNISAIDSFFAEKK